MAMTRRLYSISGLATELGKDRRTVAKALESVRPDGEIKGNGAWFILTAISVLWGSSSGERLDPAQERARKDKELADKTAMENELRRGELVEVDYVATRVGKQFATVRQRILAIPTRAAARVSQQERTAVFNVVESECHEALRNLSEGKAFKK